MLFDIGDACVFFGSGLALGMLAGARIFWRAFKKRLKQGGIDLDEKEAKGESER